MRSIRCPLGAVLSWPASIPFGPTFAAKRRPRLPCAHEHVEALELQRIVVEPGMAFAATDDGAEKAFVRVGYRADRKSVV
jgi:hypothetical protein